MLETVIEVVSAAVGLLLIIVGVVMEYGARKKADSDLDKKLELIKKETTVKDLVDLPTDFLTELLKVSPWPVAVGMVNIIVGAWLMKP
jgi:uncharacterized membrane protein HdeD (DUF308 family)